MGKDQDKNKIYTSLRKRHLITTTTTFDLSYKINLFFFKQTFILFAIMHEELLSLEGYKLTIKAEVVVLVRLTWHTPPP